MTPERAMQLHNVRDTFQHLLKISQLLSTGLDPESLTLCVRLCEMGVNPEALAFVVKELRKMAETESKGNS